MGKIYTIEEIKEKVTPIAIDYGVERVYLFGSYARGEATEKSDVDLLIDKGKIRGLFRLGGFYNALEEQLEKEVDLVTSDSLEPLPGERLNPRFSNNVKSDRRIIYEEK